MKSVFNTQLLMGPVSITLLGFIGRSLLKHFLCWTISSSAEILIQICDTWLQWNNQYCENDYTTQSNL